MGYCETHLKKEKGSVVPEIIWGIIGAFIVAFGLFLLIALIYYGKFDLSWLFLCLIVLTFGGCGFWYVFDHRKKRLSISADVENSTLVRSIRKQMPPEQANLPVPELFALVDQDLEGGQSFAGLTLGHTWALLGASALLLSNIKGIFLLKRTKASSKVVATVYEVEIYGPVRLAAYLTSASKREAISWCEKLAAAAPHAQTGGAKEQEAFLDTVRAQVEAAQQQ